MEDSEQRLLVAAARAGDPDAWEALYRALYPRLRAYVARRVEPSQVDDQVSEVMTRAVAAVERFAWGPAGGFDGWVFGIARRVTADYHRHRARSERRFGLNESPAWHGDIGDALELDDEHEAVRAAFARLTEPEREVLELRVVAGLSAEETAAVLGRRPGAVRTAQSRALAHLRRLLVPVGEAAAT